jgi:hypothetical protein
MASIASQYPADSNLTDIINDTSNEMSIWDPCPQSLSTITPIAQYRKQKSDQVNPMGVNKYFIESKQCGDWREYTNHPSDANSTYDRNTALNTMPRYRTPDSKFRFCIILAGPPGSGKSALKQAVKSDLSRRINNRVNNLPYVDLEIDDIIKNDHVFQEKLKEIPIPPMSEDGSIPINSDVWRDYIENTNKLYNLSRIGTSLTNNEVEEFALNNTNTIFNALNEKYDTNTLKLLITTKKYDELKLSISQILAKLDDSIQLSNKLFLLILTCLSFSFGLNLTYETTFKNTNSTSFLFKASQQFTNDCSNFNYIFILGLPIVKYSDLKSRIIGRFNNNIKNNIHDIGLPDFNNCSVEKNLENCYINIASLIDNCTGANKNQCYDIGIDFLVIYDNSENADKVAKFFDAVPISKRSLILAKKGQSAQATQLQIKSRRAFISLLMRNLNCLMSQASCLSPRNSIPTCSEEKCDICPNDSCKTGVASQNYDLPEPEATPGLRQFSLDSLPTGDDRDIQNEERRKKQLVMLSNLYTRRKRNGGYRKTRKIRKN